MRCEVIVPCRFSLRLVIRNLNPGGFVFVLATVSRASLSRGAGRLGSAAYRASWVAPNRYASEYAFCLYGAARGFGRYQNCPGLSSLCDALRGSGHALNHSRSLPLS